MRFPHVRVPPPTLLTLLGSSFLFFTDSFRKRLKRLETQTALQPSYQMKRKQNCRTMIVLSGRNTERKTETET